MGRNVCAICRAELKDAYSLDCGHCCCLRCAELQCAADKTIVIAKCGVLPVLNLELYVKCGICGTETPLVELTPAEGGNEGRSEGRHIGSEEEEALGMLRCALEWRAAGTVRALEKERDREEYFDNQVEKVRDMFDNARVWLRDQEAIALEEIEKARVMDRDVQKMVQMCLGIMLEEFQGRIERLERANMCESEEELKRFMDEMELFLRKSDETVASLDAQKVYVDIEGEVFDSERDACCVCPWLDTGVYERIVRKSAVISEIPAGCDELWTCGSVFDPVRKAIYECSFLENSGKDIFVTALGPDGTGECCRVCDVVPFEVWCRPVFDGKRFLYFCQRSHERSGTAFARVDCETMKAEMLPDSPRRFNGDAYGFFAGGFVYAFDAKGRGIMYDTQNGVWSESPLMTASDDCRCRFVPHPTDSGKVIYLQENGQVCVVSLADGHTTKHYYARHADPFNTPEVVALPSHKDEFILLACYGKRNSWWRVFHSLDDSWRDTAWPTTQHPTSSAVYDGDQNVLYYHINEHPTWTVVQFDQ